MISTSTQEVSIVPGQRERMSGSAQPRSRVRRQNDAEFPSAGPIEPFDRDRHDRSEIISVETGRNVAIRTLAAQGEASRRVAALDAFDLDFQRVRRSHGRGTEIASWGGSRTASSVLRTR